MSENPQSDEFITADGPDLTDAVGLSRALIRHASVTPADDGAMSRVEDWLQTLGFEVTRLKFGEIENLYARRGREAPNLCFAGHTDVVPPGSGPADPAWRTDPFAGQVKDDLLIGRGAVDMKGAIGAFIAAVARSRPQQRGSLSFLITGDEEGPATDGTKKVVEWLAARGEVISHCLVGEPTSAAQLGDMIKVGRRGSLNASFTFTGIQGHVAYPDRARNPLSVAVAVMGELKARRLDDGHGPFPPSNLEITTLDTGNAATNIIPAEVRGRINIRFNPAHSGASLSAWIHEVAARHAAESGVSIVADISISGEAFLTEAGDFTELMAEVIEARLGVRPEASTSGGTSDARFIRALCPVVEFGLVGQTMHKVNEAAPVAEIVNLSATYEALIPAYFAKFGSGS